MNARLNEHLQTTLHGILNCKCKGNCLLKSLYVDEVAKETAHINVEPFDDAFNQSDVDETVDRIKRVLLKRKKAIHKSLGVVQLSVTVYDEWTLKDAFIVEFQSHTVSTSVS